MDQTGVHLVPAASATYEAIGSKDVVVVGAEDKRQITACVASSLNGDLLPLQLIFTGKTKLCLPESTPAAVAAGVNLTFSENHWSSQDTMQQYIIEVVVPYAKQRVIEHSLHTDYKVILVLDVWAVHKSEEFRKFFEFTILIFIWCSFQQIARASYKWQMLYCSGHLSTGLRLASTNGQQKIREQLSSRAIVGLTPHLKMKFIKPLVLEWCIKSWSALKEGKEYIKFGWHTCCVSLYNVNDPTKRQDAVAESGRGELEVRGFIPEGEELESAAELLIDSDEPEDDEDKDELDVMKERVYGTRKTDRKRTQAKAFGYQISSTAIVLSEDSDH